jgi:hypothetical protein
MFEDPYWTQFEPVEYFWNLIGITVLFLLFLTGTSVNTGVIIYFVK